MFSVSRNPFGSIVRQVRWILIRYLLLNAFLLVLLGMALAACGGDGEDVGDDVPLEDIVFPTEEALAPEDVEATLFATLSPETPTPDLQATLVSSMRATRLAVQPVVTPGASGYVADPSIVYMTELDRDYMSSLGGVIWHATRVDFLISGLFLGYAGENVDLVDFYGGYRLARRAEDWRCSEPLQKALHRELLNMRAELGDLSGYSADDISRPVSGYARELLLAVRSLDKAAGAFRDIQNVMCSVGEAGWSGLGEEQADEVRSNHRIVSDGVDAFHARMVKYGCAVCGELYRR